MNRFTEATRNLLQRRRSLTAGVVAALGLLLIVVSIASASPPSGVTPTILARGSYDAFKVMAYPDAGGLFKAEGASPPPDSP